MRRIGLVVNPTAGGGLGKDVGARFARAARDAGLAVVGLSALSADVALDNVRRELPRLDALVVIGGDGMVHLGVQAAALTEVPMGVIPVGTGNDFAVATRIPTDWEAASDALLRRLADGIEPRVIDLLRVEGDGVDGEGPLRWVAGAVSAGLDAAVNARANRMRFPRGSSKYVWAAIREILSYRAWGYRLQVDGAIVSPSQHVELEQFPGMLVTAGDSAGECALTWENRGALVTAANASTIGGGIRVAPNARIDDGVLELVIARDVGALTAARLFPMMLMGTHLRSTQLRAITAKAVSISPADATHRPDVYGDGEYIGTLPVRVELVPRALRLLA